MKYPVRKIISASICALLAIAGLPVATAQAEAGAASTAVGSLEGGLAWRLSTVPTAKFQVANLTGDQSASTVITLRDQSAPTTYAFQLSLPMGASLVSDGMGGYDVLRSSGDAVVAIGHLDAPWAHDAAGMTLHTEFSLRGNTLVQSIDTHGATFPVQADPHYTWGWISGTIYFNKYETRLFTSFGTAAGFISSLGGPWSVLLRGYVAYLMTVGGVAVARGECLKVKSTLSASTYRGGYCK